jgi:hypothetical protein
VITTQIGGSARGWGGFMATEEAKVIDNAVMGFMQQRNQR